MQTWQKSWIWKIKFMSNQDLLEEYVDLSKGDLESGCMSRRGEWRLEKMKKVLYERLIACNFLENNTFTHDRY